MPSLPAWRHAEQAQSRGKSLLLTTLGGGRLLTSHNAVDDANGIGQTY